MSAIQRYTIPFVMLLCAVLPLPRETSASHSKRETFRAGYISISKSFIGIDSTANNTRTVTFTIQWGIAENVNEVEEVEYSLTCSGVATCTSQSGSFMMSKTNPSDEVTVTYTTGASGVGSVLMTATAASGSEAESEIVVQLPAPLPTGAPIVGVDVVQRLARSDCLITSAGPGGAYQCGDLVVAHAMPAYKTMNQDRRLTLLYNSAAATVQHTLPVHVTIPSGMQVPDTVRVALWIGSQEWAFKYLGSSFASGEKRRLSLSFDASNMTYGTGLYSYKLRVSNYYGSSAFHADTTHGEVVVVDRKRAGDAPYGVGWSVAGISRLYTGHSARKALVIVDADGSFVTYDSIAPTTYRAVARAYRDTIVLGTFDPGDGNATYYRQRDIDQTESYYDAMGRLRWVVDKRGQKAEYDYSATDPYTISSIRVAPWVVGASYSFAYTTAGKLQSITDPAGRALSVTINQTTGFLTSLLDPGLTQPVSMGYSTLGLLESWTSRRGHTFRYGYHLDRGLLRSASTLNKADTTHFISAQSRGLAVAGAGTAVIAAPDTAKTLIDGPRPVGDTTVFYLSRWGSPLKIRNALGHTTIIDRTSSMTVQPTRIIFPNGAQKIIVYDGRGMVKTVKDTASGVPNSVTQYTYGSPQNRSLPTLIARVGNTRTDSTHFTLNTLGLISTVTEQNGLITRFAYASDTSYAGALTTIRQDSVTTFSQTLNTKLRRRLVTRLSYDTFGNIIGDENPSGSLRTYKKDAIGRDTAFINEVNNKWSFTYNHYNQLQTSFSHGMPTDSVNESFITTYAYDQHTLKSVTDPKLIKIFEYHRDAYDRDTTRLDDNNNKDVTEYDEAGNIRNSTPRVYTFPVTFRYDVLNRLEAKKWLTRDDVPADSVVYQYNEMGQMTSAKSTNDEVVREYYGNGLLKKETQRHGVQTSTHSYKYDEFSRRTQYQMGLTEQDSLWYTYAPDGRRMSIHVRWRNLNKDSVVILFDELGRRDEVLYYVTGEPQVTRVTYAYDLSSVLKYVCSTHLHSSLGYEDLLNVSWFAQAVDSAGRAMTIDANGSVPCPNTSPVLAYVRTNKFDSHGRLSSQTTKFRNEYRYDKSGNLIAREQFYLTGTDSSRVRMTYGIKPLHNYIEYYTSKFTGDPLRKMIITNDLSQSRFAETPDSAIGAPPSLFRSYLYDGLGRLTGVTRFEITTTTDVVPTGYQEWSYLSVFSNKLWAGYAIDTVYTQYGDTVSGRWACKYDPVGRMYDPCDDTQILSFDGKNVVRTGDDRTESVQQAFSFVHGPGIDDPLLGRKGTETIIYVTNGRGDVLSFAKASGDDSAERMRDDHPMRAGGIMDAGSFSNQRAGATSSGLSYYRNRFYDAMTGRWTQSDPIGIGGGLNQHAYVGNDPASYTDPFGLCEPFCTIMDIAFIAADIHDIRKHGWSWGRGLALGGDVVAAGLPLIPALGGVSLRTGRAGSAITSAAHAASSATISAERLGHIVGRHSFGTVSSGPPAGKFGRGADIVGLIRQALNSDAALMKPGRGGRAEYEYDFGRAIGVSSTGSEAQRIRVVLEGNQVITAFPIR